MSTPQSRARARRAPGIIPRGSDDLSAPGVLTRLKHDAFAPPPTSLFAVLQLLGASPMPGTCRGFVRSLKTCKYGSTCRYSHALSPLSDADVAWALVGPPGGGEVVSIARLAPLPRLLELLERGRLESGALVHVLVRGEGSAGLGGLSEAPHRHLWSAFHGLRLWDAAPARAPAAAQGAAAPVAAEEGTAAGFSLLASLLQPPPAALLRPSVFPGLSPCLLGLPQLALARIAAFSNDASLLALRAVCRDLEVSLNDVGVWLPRLKQLPAWGGWAARNAALLLPPPPGAGALASERWGGALRVAYCSLAASCEWAAGLRFLREALVLRALVHAPQARPHASPAALQPLSGGAVRWRLPSLDLTAPPLQPPQAALAAAAAEPPAPLAIGASASRSSSPAPSPLSFNDSRGASPLPQEGEGGWVGGGGGGARAAVAAAAVAAVKRARAGGALAAKKGGKAAARELRQQPAATEKRGAQSSAPFLQPQRRKRVSLMGLRAMPPLAAAAPDARGAKARGRPHRSWKKVAARRLRPHLPPPRSLCASSLRPNAPPTPPSWRQLLAAAAPAPLPMPRRCSPHSPPHPPLSRSYPQMPPRCRLRACLCTCAAHVAAARPVLRPPRAPFSLVCCAAWCMRRPPLQLVVWRLRH